MTFCVFYIKIYQLKSETKLIMKNITILIALWILGIQTANSQIIESTNLSIGGFYNKSTAITDVQSGGENNGYLGGISAKITYLGYVWSDLSLAKGSFSQTKNQEFYSADYFIGGISQGLQTSSDFTPIGDVSVWLRAGLSFSRVATSNLRNHLLTENELGFKNGWAWGYRAGIGTNIPLGDQCIDVVIEYVRHNTLHDDIWDGISGGIQGGVSGKDAIKGPQLTLAYRIDL